MSGKSDFYKGTSRPPDPSGRYPRKSAPSAGAKEFAMVLSKKIIRFYSSIRPPSGLPGGIEVLFPQQQPEVIGLVKQFYTKYYNDNNPRKLLLGINPGRFGAGETGINFTAAKQLTNNCGIEHHLVMRSELSAEFIYEVVERYGGPEAFFGKFFLGSLSPLGFIQNGKNINYYDDRALQTALTPYIVDAIKQQVTFNAEREQCICIGEGKNLQFLTKLNNEHGFFKQIVSLPHPRFILQYKRKLKEEYVKKYLEVLNS